MSPASRRLASTSSLAGFALSAVILAVPTSAQSDLRSRVHPITSRVKNAGTLHLATGTWTRAHGGGQAFLGVAEVIVYANTCHSAYYGGQDASGQEIWTDEGALPNESMPKVAGQASVTGNNQEPGCAASYDITGFRVAYCSYQLVFTANVSFYDQYQPVNGFCAVPGAAAASFALTGLPSTPTAGVQGCWLVTLDIDGAGNFTLTGSDGTTTGNGLFGWSFNTSSPGTAATPDGPIIASDFAACSGTDATRWDRRSNLPFPANYTPNGQAGVLPQSAEEGTGMLTLSQFRIDGVTLAPAGPGCYFFQANPEASFHLELYSDVDPCTDCPASCSTDFCVGSASCPCGMAPTNPGAGCNNESNTGGAVLSATGNPSISADLSAPVVFLTLTQAPAFKTSVFIQGTTTISAAPFGDGLRCVSGALVRLNAPPPPPAPGDPTDANGSATYPTANHPLSITQRSQQAAQPIAAGQTRFYFAQYRDPSPNNCNVSLGGTVNTSQAFPIIWGP